MKPDLRNWWHLIPSLKVLLLASFTADVTQPNLLNMGKNYFIHGIYMHTILLGLLLYIRLI